jgi:uncharacterized alkaline shock family protein YloU
LRKGLEGEVAVTETSERQGEGNALQTDRGSTTIQDAVVISIVNIAAGEVDGVAFSHGGTRLPGDKSPTVGEFLGGLTGSARGTRGITVEVGETQAAIDLTVNVIYGKSIAQVAEAVRRNVISRVESLTGLEVTEVNITVNDVTFPSE